jgi:hypothetical protein
MASLIKRGRSNKRFVFSDGCWFTFLFMQPQPQMSIPFQRAEPRFTIQRSGQSLHPQNGPSQSAAARRRLPTTAALRPIIFLGLHWHFGHFYSRMIERDFDMPFVADLALREKQIQRNYRPIMAVHKWFARRHGWNRTT